MKKKKTTFIDFAVLSVSNDFQCWNTEKCRKVLGQPFRKAKLGQLWRVEAQCTFAALNLNALYSYVLTASVDGFQCSEKLLAPGLSYEGKALMLL